MLLNPHLIKGNDAMNPFDEIHEVLNRLIKENKALNTQAKLLDNFVAIARSPTSKTIVKSALRRILGASITISQAETGSMFLFDNNGSVKEKILTENAFAHDSSPETICNVIKNGLAGWVIRHRKVGCVDDTQRDERWVAHPDQLCKVRSAMAIPIQRRQRLMGLITLQHSKAYQFNRETIELMQATADQIALVLENMRLYTKLEASYRALNKAKHKVDAYSNLLHNELIKGREIQKDFFPDQPPQIPGWRFETFFKPAMQLSGDFFDIFYIDGRHIGIVIADVCDKGVGAALFMALFRSLVRIFSGSFSQYSMQKMEVGDQTRDALKSILLTNDYIVSIHNRMSTFATIFMGIIDTQNGEFTYINAGHDPPALFRASGDRHQLRPTGPVVGAFPDAKFKIERNILHSGDFFFGYTDGVTDAVSPKGEIFGRSRLKKLMDQHNKSAREFEMALKRDLFDHIADAAQTDDVTFLVVKRL
jgi:sigma-B regulation protein RsbU (phosphoserine phosphatase)